MQIIKIMILTLSKFLFTFVIISNTLCPAQDIVTTTSYDDVNNTNYNGLVVEDLSAETINETVEISNVDSLLFSNESLPEESTSDEVLSIGEEEIVDEYGVADYVDLPIEEKNETFEINAVKNILYFLNEVEEDDQITTNFLITDAEVEVTTIHAMVVEKIVTEIVTEEDEFATQKGKDVESILETSMKNVVLSTEFKEVEEIATEIVDDEETSTPYVDEVEKSYLHNLTTTEIFEKLRLLDVDEKGNESISEEDAKHQVLSAEEAIDSTIFNTTNTSQYESTTVEDELEEATDETTEVNENILMNLLPMLTSEDINVAIAESGTTIKDECPMVTLGSHDSGLHMKNEFPVRNLFKDGKQIISFQFRTTQESALLILLKDYYAGSIYIEIALHNSTFIEALIHPVRNSCQEEELLVNTSDLALNEGQIVGVSLEINGKDSRMEITSGEHIFYASSKEDYGNSINITNQACSGVFEYLWIFIGAGEIGNMESDYPSLIGCIGNLHVGEETLDLIDQDMWTYVGNVSSECRLGCEADPIVGCMNDAKCVSDFTAVPSWKCDCSDTPFIGYNCSQDVGYTFAGEDWIKGEDLIFTYDGNIRLGFDFQQMSTEAPHDRNEVLLLASFIDQSDKSHNYLDIRLEENFLSIEFCKQNSTQSIIYPVNQKIENEVHRVMVLISDGILKSEIDGEEQFRSISESCGQYSTNLESSILYIGGISEESTENNFRGCISGLFIETSGTVFPLKSYSEGVQNFKPIGLPKQGSCDEVSMGFLIPDIIDWEIDEDVSPMLGGLGELSNLTTSIPSNISTITDVSLISGKENRTWVWALIGSACAILILVLFVCCLQKICSKKKHKKEVDFEMVGDEILQDEPPPPAYTLRPVKEEAVFLLENRSESPSRPQKKIEILAKSAPKEVYETHEVPKETEPLNPLSSSMHQLDEVDSSSIEIIQEPMNPPLSQDRPLSLTFSSSHSIHYIDSTDAESLADEISIITDESSSFKSAQTRPNWTSADEDGNESYKVRHPGRKSDPSNNGISVDIQKVDLKTYHLKRKASTPPILPPKTNYHFK